MCKKSNLIDWCKENGKEYLLKEWDTERSKITIEEVSKGSKKKVWWVCDEGHNWQASVVNRVNGNGCPYCSGHKIILGKTDLATTNLKLCKEWDYEKNNIKPEEVTKGSHKKIWWLCKEGHSWEANLNSRTSKSKTGCPYCSNRGTSFPEQYLYYVLKSKFKEVSNREIIKGNEFDIYIKDINLLLEYDGVYYHRILNNKKEKELEKEEKAKEFGYDFIRVKEDSKKVKEIRIDKNNIIRYKNRRNIEDLNIIIVLLIEYINRIYGLNISKDIDKKAEQKSRELSAKEQYEKSIEVTHPELCEEWAKEKNGKLKPSQVSKGNNKKIWWLCKEGHSWESRVINRVNGCGCPYCSNNKILKGYNDIATTHPHLIKEWDYNKNTVKPEEVSAGSNKKVWCKCSKGHSWETQIKRKVIGRGCPYCSGRYSIEGKNDIQTTNPEIANLWDYKKNDELEPNHFSAGSNKKIWWLCKDSSEHSFQKEVVQMVKYQACPLCREEKKIKRKKQGKS